MHDLSVLDLTVGNECCFVLHSHKFNKSENKTAFKVKKKKSSYYQSLITSKEYSSFLLEVRDGH